MKGNKKMSEKSGEEEREIKIKVEEFPKITITKAVDYIEKILKSKGRVILREDFMTLINKKGGRFNSILKSLRDYGLLVSSGKSELTVTDLGERLGKHRRPKDIFDVFLSIPIHKKIFVRYSKIIPERKVLINFVKSSVGKDAKFLAGLYRENMKSLTPLLADVEESGEVVIKPSFESTKALDEDLYKIINLIGYLNPPEDPKIETLLNELIKLCENKGLEDVKNLIKVFKVVSSEKTEEQMKEDFKKIAPSLITTLKKEIGLK